MPMNQEKFIVFKLKEATDCGRGVIGQTRLRCHLKFEQAHFTEVWMRVAYLKGDGWPKTTLVVLANAPAEFIEAVEKIATKIESEEV